MLLGIESDMPLEIRGEASEPGRIRGGQVLQEPDEHCRDQILPAQSESSRQSVKVGTAGQGQRQTNMRSRSRRHACALKSLFHRLVGPKGSQETGDQPRVGFGVSHGFQVQLEVAQVATPTVLVTLLVQHDLVEQSPRDGIDGRQPGDRHTGQVALKTLEE
jgi:hypothetical protein